MARRPDCVTRLLNGNLPNYTKVDNPCNIDISKITMDGITLSNFNANHIRCPFDIEPTGDDSGHLVRNTNPLSVNYWNFEVAVPPDQRAQHTTTSGILIKWNRGNIWGWICPDDMCPYHLGITVDYNGEQVLISKPGDRYFYI